MVYNVEITVIDLDLYSEHRPEERITGSKTDFDLSAGSTYTRVYMVNTILSLLYIIILLKISHQLPIKVMITYQIQVKWLENGSLYSKQ